MSNGRHWGPDDILLYQLEQEIPVLAEKLRILKITRKRLKAALQMKANQADPEYRAKAIAAVRARNATPEARQHWATAGRNQGNPLPCPKGTPEHYRYRQLTRKGWTRPEAISKIHAEGA